MDLLQLTHPRIVQIYNQSSIEITANGKEHSD